ncbi:hypothetical protein MAR_006955 [Mya arenaria]|uniref:Uncharacterized protein n=1 Tax=Mya arenaria TaxID=6604 RepID=A0ABY7DA00_MYAAR|nr:hypothetical protein MAR_006955 [Mya arenaria]
MKWIYFCLIIWQTWMTVGSWWPGYIIGMKKCRENGQFYCNVSRRCISKSDVCDGYNGCSGGEDESPPACGLTVSRMKAYNRAEYFELLFHQANNPPGLEDGRALTCTPMLMKLP